MVQNNSLLYQFHGFDGSNLRLLELANLWIFLKDSAPWRRRWSYEVSTPLEFYDAMTKYFYVYSTYYFFPFIELHLSPRAYNFFFFKKEKEKRNSSCWNWLKKKKKAYKPVILFE